MARRRHALNPVKIKADFQATQPPQASVEPGQPFLQRRLTVALLALLSVVLLSVAFAPWHCWPLAYAAMASWVIAVCSGRRRWALLWGWLAGLIFWSANVYWLWWITLLGWAALVLYMSSYWFVSAVVVRSALGRGLPAFAVLPVVWVAGEFAREHVISGFAWFFLGHSQYLQTPLIQIADTTGVYGISFFVAMVNGALADVVLSVRAPRPRGQGRLSRNAIAGLTASVLAGAAMLGYGAWRMSQRTTSEGPSIGLVQRSYPIALNKASADEQRVLDSHLSGLHALAGAGCDLLVMPETMLPRALNSDFMDLDLDSLSGDELRSLGAQILGSWACQQGVSEQEIRDVLRADRDGVGIRGLPMGIPHRRQQLRQLDELLLRSKCPLLGGGTTVHRSAQPIDRTDAWVCRNSALWFNDARQEPQVYSKMHLVPFSEYVPFKSAWPWLHRLLRRLVPPVMTQLDPGGQAEIFELVRGDNKWRIAAPICYEGTFARVCRRLVMSDGRKQADVLVNLSNDGWFVWAWGQPRGSTEHHQHLAQYVFRAIENRVPVVRAVNTGISASIDSTGRIVSVVQRHVGGKLRRDMVNASVVLGGSGPLADKDILRGPAVLVDSRTSLYSAAGDVFALAAAGAAMAMAVWLSWRRLTRKEGH